MPKLFDWSGKKVPCQNVNLDERQQKKLAEKHCVACIFNELKKAGFTHDYGNTRCFNAAKDAVKKLGYTAHPDRLCQFAMEYLLKERDADAEEAWFAELRL